MASADTASSDTWSLSVKAIGSTLKECTNAGNDLETTPEKNFTVTVSPDDAVTELYDKIETATGLKASQQRLIYRGRIIDSDRLKSDSDAPTKIGDIVGLNDGHTIHLVKRQEPPREQQREDNATSSNSSTTPSTAASSLDRDEGGSGTASLLAALIGLGGLEDGDYTPSTGRQRWRAGRLGRSRRPHYRLTAEDLQVPDPGTLEPVRQGLMTIHTMLPHAQIREDVNPSPLAANRRWYRGQWIDVRDTVNAWLEATIVDILNPDDILGPRDADNDDNKQEVDSEILEPHTDPAVSAGDMEGRRRLLLEPCDEGDSDEEGGELAGFRRRKTNKGVKVLLIHYNGWPHRWDEWIRSDSERIRPFRTRTRHPSMATHSSPTTQSAFNESPPTHIVDDDNTLERPAILPELSRAVTAVNELLALVASEESAQLTDEQQENLPWAVRSMPTSAAAAGESNVYEVDEDLDELPPLTGEHGNPAELPPSTSNSSNMQSRLRRRQLQMLAPLLDRLGRTLVDAAPHVAALAQAASENDTEESVSTAEAVVTPQGTAEESNPSTLGGLLSLLGRDRRRQNISDAAGENIAAATPNEQSWPVDPDYVDFATGSVNTTRGEVRSGPRSRSSNDDVAGLLGAYLAAASLGLNTSGGSSGGGSTGDGDNDESGGNVLGLLRGRGNGGGNGGAGIDIHIHAVVTTPGGAVTTIGGGGGGTGGVGGGLGLAALGGPPTTPAAVSMRNALSSPSRERRESSGGSLLRMRTPTVPVVTDEEEDMGIFAELYSDSPEPVDPNSSPQPGTGREESPVPENDILARLGHTHTSAITFTRGTSQRDHTAVSPARLSRNSSDASSSRRSSTNGNSPRRGSMLGRLFRRSRRSSQG